MAEHRHEYLASCEHHDELCARMTMLESRFDTLEFLAGLSLSEEQQTQEQLDSIEDEIEEIKEEVKEEGSEESDNEESDKKEVEDVEVPDEKEHKEEKKEEKEVVHESSSHPFRR